MSIRIKSSIVCEWLKFSFECVLIVVFFFYNELFLYQFSLLVCKNFDTWDIYHSTVNSCAF